MAESGRAGRGVESAACCLNTCSPLLVVVDVCAGVLAGSLEVRDCVFELDLGGVEVVAGRPAPAQTGHIEAVRARACVRHAS
jgi:hypothetical protein